MLSPPLSLGGEWGCVFGIARRRVAGDVLLFPHGVAGLSGAAKPAQVEFVVAAVAFVNGLIKIVGGFSCLVW